MAVSQVSDSKPIVSPNKKKKKKSKKNLTQSHSQSDPVQSQEEAAPLLPQPPCNSPSKRTKCPGVRVVGGRIYDSENGKTCHQCRQKTMNFSASCKNRKNDKLCPVRFCHKCLLNRYGEKAEEMAVLDEWKCPKCRGICNCSVCMKRRGHQPTGLLVHTAKATGFSSVSEMLNVKGLENLALEKTKLAATNKDPMATPIRKCGKENPFNGKNDSNLQPLSSIPDGEGDKGQCRRKKVRQNDNADEGGITSASLKKRKAFKNVVATPNERTTPNKDPVATPIRKCGKENPFDKKNDSNLQTMSSISDGECDKGQCGSKKVRQNDNAGEGGITSASSKKQKAFKNVVATPNEHTTPNKDPMATPIRKCGKENPFNGKNDSNLQPLSSIPDGEGDKGQCRSKKVKQNEYAGEGGITSASLKKHKAFKNVVATPNEHTTPNKELFQGPTRKYFKEKHDLNLQPTPSTLDCEAKKIEESRWKELRQKDDGGEGSDCGNSLFEKKCSKVSQISEENHQKIIKKEKKRSQCNDGCPNKVNSVLQSPKKISLDPRKKEGKNDEGYSFLSDCDKTEVPYGNMDNATTKPKRVTKSRDARKNIMTTHNSSVDTQLPQGANLTIVAGIDLATEDVGHALQFLEFCAAFGEVLDLKKGQPESILQELLCRRSGRRSHRTQYSSNVQFHTQLLFLIQKDLGEESYLLGKTSSSDSWLKALGKCISESHFVLKDLPVDCFDRGGDSYDKLDSSQKLRVLNFLCDETLGTVKLRNWIDEQDSKFVEREKEAKDKVLAAKNKEKCLKWKLKDDLAKAIQLKRAPLSISEHEDIVSRIKVEAAKAHSETLESMSMAPKKKQRSDAVRTEPVLLDGDGCAYWKLRCHSSEPILLLQDIGNLDWVRPEEKWYTYNVEQTKVVEKYISSFRTKGIKSVAVSDIFPLESSKGSLKHESPYLVVADSEDDQES